MIVSTAFGWSNVPSIAISVVLAFLFGYALTLRSVVNAGVGLRRAISLALASDTLSIATMEIVDNAFIVVVPGAMAAGLGDGLFWWSLAVSLAIAFVVAVDTLADRPRPCGRARTARALTEAGSDTRCRCRRGSRRRRAA